MTVVNILTQGSVTGNGAAFLFPIVFHAKALRATGIRCRIYKKAAPGLTDCEVLIVDSKFYKAAWAHGSAPILEELNHLRQQAGRLLWFDTTDSTGTLQTPVLPLVDRYYKNFVLKDRSLYKKPFYGMRIFTDFYHRNYGVVDEQPKYSEPVNERDLAKICVGWNPGMGDHSLWTLVRGKLFRLTGWRSVLKRPTRWVPPSTKRAVKLKPRFGMSHSRATVRFHRERVGRILGDRLSKTRIGRRAYVKELEDSKAVISPFSWSEFTYRDFEAFIAGCLLIKPNMGHLETWPDIYQDGVTYVSYHWTLDDLADLLDRVDANYDEYIDIARFGQANYRAAIVGDHARDAFVARFAGIVRSG